jgi:adenosinetriphosphatase
MQKGKFS